MSSLLLLRGRDKPRPVRVQPAMRLANNGNVALQAIVGATSVSGSVAISNAPSAATTLVTPRVGTVAYPSGGTGWISSATIAAAGNDQYTLSYSGNPSALAVGTHVATIPVTSYGCLNGNQVVTLTLTVSAQPTALLTLTKSLDDAATTVGGATPASEVVGVVSGNGIALAGPTIQSVTYSGAHSGWATATLSGQTLTVAYNIAGISTAGASFCYVTVVDANAANAVTYTVYLVVGTPAAVPSIRVQPSSIARSIFAGNNAASGTITVTNGGGTLAQLGTVTAAWVSAPAWASFLYTPATGALDFTFNTTALPTGTVSAVLRLTAPGVSNSPVDIPVQVQVLPVVAGQYPVPTLPVPPDGYAWDASKGYATGSVFNALASYRGADNGAMPTFSGTEYVVGNQSQWNTVAANLANGTIVDGDIVTITAGVTITQPQLAKRPGWTEGTSGFVWIRSSGYASLPAYAWGNGPTSYSQANCVDRTTHAAYLATFETTLVNTSSFCPQVGAGGYWFTGIDFKANTANPTGINAALSAHVGSLPTNAGVTYQQTLADVPTCFVFDRCVFSTGPNGAQNMMTLDGRYVRVVHCDLGYARYYSPSTSPPARPECHGFVTYNTDGRIEVLGNKFAANGIGWLIGGAPPAINNIVPTDIVMMWNRMHWPLNFGSEYDAQSIKNAGEFKTGVRGIFAFNDIMNLPLNPNQRYAFLCKATDQPVGYSAADPNGHPTGYPARVAHIAIWGNRIRNSAKGLFGIADTEVHPAGEPGGEVGCDTIEVAYNYQQWLSPYTTTYYGVPVLAEKRAIAFDKGGGNGVDTLWMHHNTTSGAHDMVFGPDVATNGGGWRNVQYHNNVHTESVTYGPVFASGNAGSAMLDQRVGAGNWSFKRNYVVSGGANWDATLRNALWDNGQLTVADFVDPANLNFSLKNTTRASASFAGGGGGTDGKDCGYDYAYLVAMLGDIGN